MPAPKRKTAHRPKKALYSDRELNELRRLEADIHAGRITETDGTSLEEHMERAFRRAARALRSRA